MSRNLNMPWGIDDTVENMERIRDIMIKKVRSINLDGNAEEDVCEVNFDFNRVKKALEKQIPMKPNEDDCCVICNTHLKDDNDVEGLYCPNCGQKVGW